MTPKEIARAKEIAGAMRLAHQNKQNAARAQEMLEKLSKTLRAAEVVRIDTREKKIG